jgi:hypothetical protein
MVTRVVRAPVRPATLWMRVVSMASGKGIAGRMVVRQRANIELKILLVVCYRASFCPSSWVHFLLEGRGLCPRNTL